MCSKFIVADVKCGTKNIKNHIATHTGIKKYKCSRPGCKHSFVNRPDFRVHVKGHERKSAQFHEFLEKLSKTNIDLLPGVSESAWIAARAASGGVDATCSKCNYSGKLLVNNFIYKGRLMGCFCNGRVYFASPEGKKRIVDLVASSRFEFVDSGDVDAVETQKSKINLCCSVCKVRVNTSVMAICNGTTGCICDVSAQSKATKFVYSVVNTLVGGSSALQVLQEAKCNGLNGQLLPLRVDIVIQDTRTGEWCFGIEIDGPHHFDPLFQYDGVGAVNTEVFAYDCVKEDFFNNASIPFVRMDAQTVYRERCNWRLWLQSLICRHFEGTPQLGINRLSEKDVYKTGKYALLRKNKWNDPELEQPIQLCLQDIVVEVPHDINLKQRKIDDFLTVTLPDVCTGSSVKAFE
jgi:hypothetical protein